MTITFENNAWLRDTAIAAVKVESSTRYPPIALLTQAAVESAWGTKVTGDWNFWGIKRHPETGPAKFCKTTEDLTAAQFAQLRSDERNSVTNSQSIGGGRTRYWMSCWFASYSSAEESVRAYVDFILGNSRYHPAWQQYQATQDPYELLRGIARAGYATGQGYEQLLMTVGHQQNIQHAAFMAAKELSVGVVS